MENGIKNKFIQKGIDFLKEVDTSIEETKEKAKEIKQKIEDTKTNLANISNNGKKKNWLEVLTIYWHKKTTVKNNKDLILSYLANGLKRGNNLLTLISKYKETLEPEIKDEAVIISILDEIIEIVETKGTNTTYILYQVGLLTEKEYLIISNYNDLHLGLELVLKMNKQQNNFNWAIALFFFPPFVVLIGLVIFQPEMKEFAYTAIEPINAHSKKMIKIPEYLEDRTFFLASTFLFTLFYILTMYTIEMVKKFKPHSYFRYFRLAEKEFIVNTFSSLLNLRKSGKSYVQSYKILSETSKDPFIKNFFDEIHTETKQGNIKGIYSISKKYNMDKFNLSYFKTGTLNNDLDNTVETILEYNKEKYEKQIALLVKFLPLIGEIIMTIILLKPLIDIIMVTTVDVMNFTL